MRKFSKSILTLLLALIACAVIFTACDEGNTQQTEPPHTHVFGDWKTITEPTCTETGSKERICECGEKETEAIDTLGHTEGEWIIDKEATENETGAMHQLCSVCGATIKEENIPIPGPFKYTVNDDGTTCTIISSNKFSETELNIPEYIDGYKVTNIGFRALSSQPSLKIIVIPETVVNIDEEAFYKCRALTEIIIPSSVKSIGNRAFSNCDSLTEVTIPSSVTLIGSQIFSNSQNLTTVYYNSPYTVDSNTNGYPSNHPLWRCKATKVIFGGECVPEGILNAISSVKEVVISDNVKSIGEDAFIGCPNLEKITIGNGVSSISKGAFSYCTNLKDVIISSSVTSIEDRAFFGCTNLTEITIPASINNISATAFENTPNLSTVYYNSTYIPDHNSEEEMAFSPLYNASKIIFGCEYIPSDMLVFNRSVKEIVVLDNVSSIGYRAFQTCENLDSITIGNGVTSIGYLAFAECTNLKKVIIGKSLASIGQMAFFHCTNLSDIKYNGTIEQWKIISKDALWAETVPTKEVICINGTAPIN